MPARHSPALSVIVPVLEEAAILPDLFRTLTDQRGLAMELILCDGGSNDATPVLAGELARQSPFPCRIVTSGRGRGRQMNSGAAIANGKFLLFLHADSQFEDPYALFNAVAALEARRLVRSNGRTAGHFALQFRRAEPYPSLAYYFYECKARLDRPGCIHGDQGFLLRRTFFAEVGPFDESLPFFEDDRMAARVRAAGEWQLLPAKILTSARRFESEGLCQRQILNALLMNFAAIGWNDFFAAAGDLYRQQNRTSLLNLNPFFRTIDELMGQLSWGRRLRFWYRTGGFVRNNAWQPAFFCDIRRRFAAGLPAGTESLAVLSFFDRYLEPLTDHPPGRLFAALLTWCWFHCLRLRFRYQSDP